MSASSDIEWTDATWNPTVGCDKISPGCKHCYAKTMHARLTAMGQKKYADPFEAVRAWPPHLAEPLGWRKPQRIFVNSMSDLFHEDVPDDYIDKVLAVMLLGHWHTYQVLTKRAERLPRYLNDPGLYDRVLLAANRIRRERPELGEVGISNPSKFPAKWIWWGVSVEDQQRADERIPDLLCAPAAVRFLSCEPLLGPVDIRRSVASRTKMDAGAIGWVICGGESGIGARPMHPEWARSLRDQCTSYGIPFHFKQWGSWGEIPYDHESPPCHDAGGRERYLNLAGGWGFHGERVIRMRRASKKGTGRLLDGREWNEFPRLP